MKDVWDITPTSITIRRGGKTPGCVMVALIIIGLGIASPGVLIYLERINIPDLDSSLPVAVFAVAFGLFWLLAGVRSRNSTPESTLVIDSFNNSVRFDLGDTAISIPFADLQSVIIHETRTQQSNTTSIHARTSGSSAPKYSYTYRVYLQKRDGAIFWVWSFSHKGDALEHVGTLLERVEISCIDRAGGTLERTVQNPYQFDGPRESYAATSTFVDVEQQPSGARAITLRYSRFGFRGVSASFFLFGTFLGIPLWFFAANQPLIPGWFLIIPGVFLFFAVIALFLRGRRYRVLCSPPGLEVSVRFWFPLFQMFFGKTASVPAESLKAVRVNRYEDDEFHLELGIDGDLTLPRMSRAAFNSGAVRMLPRDVLGDTLNHIGLWSVLPMAQKQKGPSISDLYAIEQMLQEQYNLDRGNA